MKTIVLDYCDGSVSVIEHRDDVDIESLLLKKSFRLNDCEWMTVEDFVIKNCV